MLTIPPAHRVHVISGLRELVGRYDLLLCDVWGVVHDGRRAFAEAADALSRFRAHGGMVVLLTNAARPHGPVIAQLDRLGVPRDAYDAIVTSGDATAALIAARGVTPAFHIGPSMGESLFERVAEITGVEMVLNSLADSGYAICTGLFDDATETPDDYRDLLAAMRARDLDMICANPDIVVHIGDRLIYCAGALAKAYAALGGRVSYAGKPHAPIYRVALDLAAKRRDDAPVDPRRVLAVGDGLPTDIAGARRQDLDALFVTTGIHREETIDSATGALDPDGLDRLLAAAGERPALAITRLVW